MTNEKNKKSSDYGKIVDSTLSNKKLSDKDKKAVIGGVADSLREEMFGGDGNADALALKTSILSLDAEIIEVKNTFFNEKNLANDRALKTICLKQKNNLQEYAKIENKTLILKNKNLDELIAKCIEYEGKLKNIEEGYARNLKALSVEIAGVINKEFKTRNLVDYKNLRHNALKAKDIICRAEKEKIHIPRLEKMSLSILDKHIELADKQIAFFEQKNKENIEKIRALDQEIKNALSASPRTFDVSMSIIKLCKTMKSQIEFFISKGTIIPKLKFTDLNNLDNCIAIEEERIQKERERKKKWEEEQRRRMQECVEKVCSYDAELEAYKDPSVCAKLSFEDCREVVTKARKLKKEIEYLKEKKWKVPTITWYNPDFLIQKMEHRMNKIKALRDELISDLKARDERISGMVHRDYKVLSIDECRQIIGVCKEQKRKMEYCESKGVHISGLSNRDMDFWINKFEDLCQKKRDWEREQRERERERQQRERERERQQREREREREQRERERQKAQEQRDRERAQREREKAQREKERQQREHERQREQERRDRERAQREREKIQREKERQQREREKQQRIAREAQEIYEGLKRYTDKRVSLQNEMEKNWQLVRNGVSRKEQLDAIFKDIGSVNNEINKLIGRLFKYPKQYSCYKLAMDYLRREIDRSRQLQESWRKKIDSVNKGRISWITKEGKSFTDSTFAYNYIKSLEGKVERYREQLRRLEELNQR